MPRQSYTPRTSLSTHQERARGLHHPRRKLLLPFIAFGLGLALIISSVVGAAPASQQTKTPSPAVSPTFDISRLDAPATADPPRQVDRGAAYYWGACMGCHGDYGQGLTAEWRDSYGEDRDCWQSGCHGADTTTFELDRENPVPAIAGPGKLARFNNAYELHTYILEEMPWWNPGSISREEAWATTNYLLKLNDAGSESLTLTSTNGAAISVQHKTVLPESEWPGTLALAGLLGLAAIGIGAQAIPKRTKPNFIHHLHPPSIPRYQSRFRYTLGAGGLAIFFSLILLVTGLLEMFFYIPSVDQAAISIEMITTLVPFGNLIRNLHFWSAQILLIVVTAHLLRVVLTGAYARQRRFNFLLGLALLVIILLLDFTGYVLRWDEGIRWALVVGTNLLKTIPWIGESIYRFVMGGVDVGPAALTRFYAWHIFGLTGSAFALTIWHIFRVRRDGGIAVPPPEKRNDNTRITRSELLRREVQAMLIAGIFLLLLSMLIPAPIDQPLTEVSANTSDSSAPWFFLWVQQLLNYGNPFVWGVLTPALILLALGLIPYILPEVKAEELGRWFPRRNWIAQALVTVIILVILALTVIGAIQ